MRADAVTIFVAFLFWNDEFIFIVWSSIVQASHLLRFEERGIQVGISEKKNFDEIWKLIQKFMMLWYDMYDKQTYIFY